MTMAEGSNGILLERSPSVEGHRKTATTSHLLYRAKTDEIREIPDVGRGTAAPGALLGSMALRRRAGEGFPQDRLIPYIHPDGT